MSQLDFVQRLWPSTSQVAGRSAKPGSSLAIDQWPVAGGTLVVRYLRHPRARRYRLSFQRDGTARCTVPRRGTLAEARRFVASHEKWLTERWRQYQAQPALNAPLRPGGTVWLRGLETSVQVGAPDASGAHPIRIGEVEFGLTELTEDLRPAVDRALRLHATEVLVQRTRELATQHELTSKIRRVSIRNQRTRWGSCSVRGLICLNWRLLQVPPFVCDYVILHELAHLRHLNHSPRFWAEVERLCPEYKKAEDWLRRSGRRVL